MEPNSGGLLRVWPRQRTEAHSLSTTWGVVGFPPSLAHLKTTLLKNNYHKNTDTQCTDSQAEERVLRDRRGRVSGPLRPQRETRTVSKELHDVFSSLLFCPLGIALANVSQKDLGLFIANSTLNLHKDIIVQAFRDGQNLQSFQILSRKKHEMDVIPYLRLFLLGWFCLVYQTQLGWCNQNTDHLHSFLGEMNSRCKQRLACSVLCMCFRLWMQSRKF